MHNMLIVDDEFHIRDGIANAVEWEKVGIQISGVAANAIEAMELMEEQWPDLIITDINLGEGMNGLEFVEYVTAMRPLTRIVILSGYDEFEYARKALALRVHSYLLKPVLPRELLENIRKVIDEMNQQQAQMARIKLMELEHETNKLADIHRMVEHIIEGNLDVDPLLNDKLAWLGFPTEATHFCSIVLRIDNAFEWGNTQGTGYLRSAVEKMLTTLGQIDHPSIHILAGKGSNYDIRLLVALKNKRAYQDLPEHVRAIQLKIKNVIDPSVTASIGGCHPSLDQLCKSYAEALLAMDYKMNVSKDSLIIFSEVNKWMGRTFTYPVDKEQDLLHRLAVQDERIEEAVEAFFHHLQAQNALNGDFRLSVIELFSSVKKHCKQQGTELDQIFEKKQLNPFYVLERMDTFDDVKNWFIQIVNEVIAHGRKEPTTHMKSAIQKAREYMNLHYTDLSVSLQAIADFVYLNPAYFSKLYKQETGETYMETITKLRIRRAKILLKETRLRMNDIGISVGYPNPTYFSSKFKKYTGLTPLEYREEPAGTGSGP